MRRAAIARRAASVRCGSRPTIQTSALRCASAVAAARPRPPVAPVIERDAAAHVDNGLGIPIEQRTACDESDAAEAADDRRFERGVGEPARTVEARHACTAARRVRRPAAARSPMRWKTIASNGSASRADALGVELRVVDHDGTVFVVFERDRVDGTDRAVLGAQHDPLGRGRTRRSRSRGVCAARGIGRRDGTASRPRPARA